MHIRRPGFEFWLCASALEFWQHDPRLALVLALLVLVADFARFVPEEKQNLAQPLIRVDAGGQRCGVRDFKGHEAFPLRLKRRDVDDDPAARIGRLADADGEHIAWNLEVFHRAGQGERIWRNDANIRFQADKRALVKFFWIHDGAVHVGEYLEFVGDPEVISVTRETVRDNTFADLFFRKGADHVLLDCHFSDPTVTHYGHGTPGCGGLAGSFVDLRNGAVILRNRGLG